MCAYVKSKKERIKMNKKTSFDITILKIDLKMHNNGVPSLFQ